MSSVCAQGVGDAKDADRRAEKEGDHSMEFGCEPVTTIAQEGVPSNLVRGFSAEGTPPAIVRKSHSEQKEDDEIRRLVHRWHEAQRHNGLPLTGANRTRKSSALGVSAERLASGAAAELAGEYRTQRLAGAI